MAYPPQEQELRHKAFPWLPGSDFDDALKEAGAYHEEHPPLEEGLIGNTNAPLPEDAKPQQGMVDTINHITAARLLEEHVEKAMRPFVKKSVPHEIARQIVVTLVMKN